MSRLLVAATVATIALAAAVPAQQQKPAPAAPQRRPAGTKPSTQRTPDGRVNEFPHVSRGTWFGHASPDDRRFALAKPFEHGRFDGVGRANVYAVARVDAALHRIWLPGGYGFEVAAWDWPFVDDWCWTCGSEYVVYIDEDHPGWYLIYDMGTEGFVHATYLGVVP
ncbi:MAG: hypothetical protein IT356_00670 [Gemmatimonadaceae bacterium]|nr:hypothetical protein [Gemmatimonadaceae bacterium]